MSFIMPLISGAARIAGGGRLAAFTAGRMVAGGKDEKEQQPQQTATPNPSLGDVIGKTY